jgi:hypothetical protein
VIKFRFTRIGIPLFTYTLAVRLPLLKGQHERTGRKTLQPRVNNSLILNLNLCRKRKLNPERISLLKRKAPHRKKRIPRKKQDGKVKNTESPVHRAGLLFTPLLEFWFRIIAPSFCDLAQVFRSISYCRLFLFRLYWKLQTHYRCSKVQGGTYSQMLCFCFSNSPIQSERIRWHQVIH